MAGSESFQIVSLPWMGQTELMSGSVVWNTNLHRLAGRHCFTMFRVARLCAEIQARWAAC
jgi:hypothetical protein